jgi:hypothetical protein
MILFGSRESRKGGKGAGKKLLSTFAEVSSANETIFDIFGIIDVRPLKKMKAYPVG